MATAGDGKALYGSGGAGEKFHKSPIETGGNYAATGRISELEEMLKQVTVTMSSLSVSQIPHNYLQPTTMESLPDELMIDIFIRLLAKQLAQMRCVSKSWNALLSHPSFVKSHLHRSIHNNDEQILLAFYDGHKSFTEYSFQSLHLERTNVIKHTHVDLPKKIIGSVNGLICLSEYSYSNIHIWNPSLSALSAIPLPHSLTSKFTYIHNIRFGFDPKTEDYKLVMISGVCRRRSVKKLLQVEVYSMRKRSWEFITQRFPSHISITSICNFDDLCVDGHDGHLHWKKKADLWTEHTILAFDLASETFREIPLPHSELDFNYSAHRLGVLGGKLCEMSWHRDGAWEVWVLEEYGVPESWVKHHAFSQFNNPFRLYGFTSRSELLLVDKDCQLVFYDPIANKTKFTCTEYIAYSFAEYVDSLVWV